MNQLERLSEPFPAEVERTLRKGGTSLTYIPVSEVIARLNNVLGVNGWSYSVKDCGRDSESKDWIIALVTLAATIDGQEVHKDGCGGQEVKYMKGGEKPVDLGNEFKGAVSDALKKAAQSIGVGLYLARSEEALIHEQQEPQTDADIEVAALWGNFKGFTSKFSPEQKAALGEFWNEYGGGREKPTESTATMEDLTALLEKCVQINLGAEDVTE
jgi:hypothetical protein